MEDSLQDSSDILASAAEWVGRHGLSAPAVFFLESSKPLCGVASHIFLASAPLLAALFGAKQVKHLQNLLSSPHQIEQLIRRIEDYQ